MALALLQILCKTPAAIFKIQIPANTKSKFNRSDQICVIKVIVTYKAALHNSSQDIGAVQLIDLLSSGW